jgi:hypothetical protein
MKVKDLWSLLFFFALSASGLCTAQIYQHNFGTTTISTHPYTVAPAVLDANLSSSSWTNSTGAWTSFAGSAGQAISLNNSGGTPTITLSFSTAAGYETSISSFSFWRQRSTAGAQNWSMTINGISVGSGTAPTTGASTGSITVSNPVNNQAGTITVVISLSGASGAGTFRIDDFTLNGTVSPTCTPPAAPSSPAAAANPSCGATTLNVMVPPSGETWYWQGTNSNGSSTSDPTSSAYNVSSSGTYYVRARNNATSCWSTSSSSLAVTINTSPAVSVQPSNAGVTTGSTATFSLSATGAGLTYQWQENQGSGFVNLADGGIYSGCSTSSLSVSGVSAAMSGWQYQCIATGTCSPSTTSSAATLSIVTTAVGDYRTRANGNWASNTTWEKWNGSSWIACSSGDFPDAGTANVEILAHTVDLDGGGSPPFDCKNLSIQSGGILWTGHFTASNAYVQVYGNITCNGTIGVSTGDDICFDIAGGTNCTISGTGNFYATRIRKDGSISSSSNSSLVIDMNIFLFWSTGSGTILYNDGTPAYFDITINAGKTVKGITSGLVSNNVSMDGLSGSDGSTSGGSYTVYGTLEIDGTVYATTNNTSRPVTITIKNGGIIKCAYVTASASSAASCIFNIEGGGKLVLTGSDASSNAFASFSLTNNSYTLSSASTVEYAGTAAQNVESQLAYSNITFSGGGSKTLNGSTSVSGIATFTSGQVNSTSANILNMLAGSSALSASNSSFVNGPVIKTGNTDFIFPVGKDAAYRPIYISSLTGTETFNAEYFHSDPDGLYSRSSKDSSLNNIGACEYWILDRSGTENAVVSLSWSTYSCGVSSLPDLAVARWNGTQWKDHGNGGTSGTTSAGVIASATAITSFSPFTLASIVAGVNPLPVTLTHFSAETRNKQVQLRWNTATEKNNDHFSIERSADAQTFFSIAEVAGQGTTSSPTEYEYTDKEPLPGYSYYRLKQQDYDGAFEYSTIRSVFFDNANIEIINIAQDEAGLNVVISCEEEEIVLELYDMKGALLARQSNTCVSVIRMSVQEMKQGIYLLKATAGNACISKKIMIR